MTAEEFFAWQATQDRLYELVDGFPVLPLKMMTGASQTHDRVVVNVIASLHRQPRGSPCRPTTDDLAVRIPAGNVRRRDVTVECGSPGPRDMAVSDPRLVVEVLSPSTMSFDRFRKVEEDKSIGSLVHILLIDTETPRVTRFSRAQGERRDIAEHVGLDRSIDLPEIGAALALADVFEGVAFARDRPAAD